MVDLDARLKREDALVRTRAVMVGGERAPDPTRDLHDGAHILVGADGALTLAGAPLAVGSPIEVFTNRANGWVRGRLEWSGRKGEAPRLAINVWDPAGDLDEDGLPPWVGALETPLPPRARVRRG